MTRLVIPNDVTWELVVVNNRSTDNTDEVIASFRDRLPIRRTWEPSPGLANARNRALAEATGDYILWTDDDVLVDESWIAGYVSAFRRWPNADIFGGPIHPLFEGDPPNWLHRVLDQIGAAYGHNDLGAQAVSVAQERAGTLPYGGNMAMRRVALLQYRFNPDLGVRHGSYSIGEETDVISRMLAAGHTGWWTPDARVRHWIPRANQTVDYVRRWMIGCGRYKANSLEHRLKYPHRNGPHWLFARMVRYELQFQLRRLVVRPEVWIMDLVRANQARGEFQASIRSGTRR
jgi:glycosyltransferase involved in cell wall biosynthesis